MTVGFANAGRSVKRQHEWLPGKLLAQMRADVLHDGPLRERLPDEIFIQRNFEAVAGVRDETPTGKAHEEGEHRRRSDPD